MAEDVLAMAVAELERELGRAKNDADVRVIKRDWCAAMTIRHTGGTRTMTENARDVLAKAAAKSILGYEVELSDPLIARTGGDILAALTAAGLAVVSIDRLRELEADEERLDYLDSVALGRQD